MNLFRFRRELVHFLFASLAAPHDVATREQDLFKFRTPILFVAQQKFAVHPEMLEFLKFAGDFDLTADVSGSRFFESNTASPAIHDKLSAGNGGLWWVSTPAR
jgi:hypothetical protein